MHCNIIVGIRFGGGPICTYGSFPSICALTAANDEIHNVNGNDPFGDERDNLAETRCLTHVGVLATRNLGQSPGPN